MDETRGEFERIVGAILHRFCRQGGRELPSAMEVSRFSVQLRELIRERGLPRPLTAEELGTPGGMSEAECAPLLECVMRGLTNAALGEAARQMVKACFYPEFKVCRDSFREVSRDGVCRRQELERVRGRISGAHCVDCPHWVALEPEPHRAFLRSEWCGDRVAFDAHADIFLPEDFRALRRWLHAEARCRTAPPG